MNIAINPDGIRMPFFRKISAPRPVLGLYVSDIPLDRLRLGVDNLRFDVHLSETFRAVSSDLIFQLIIKHSGASPPLRTRPRINWFTEIKEFKEVCGQIMADAVNQAKAAREIEIDYLAQAALVKFFLNEIRNQYDKAIFHFKNVIRRQEVSQQMEAFFILREEVSGIVQMKDIVIQKTGEELFSYFLEVCMAIDDLRVSNFGKSALLRKELAANPLLHAPDRPGDRFMMDNYVLLGRRIEDPLNYRTIIKFVAEALSGIDFDIAEKNDDDLSTEKPAGDASYGHAKGVTQAFQMEVPSVDPVMDRILMSPENIEILFEYQTIYAMIKSLKKKGGDKRSIRALKAEAASRKKRLGIVYKSMERENVLRTIVASCMLEPLIDLYCPPLSPQEILQYIAAPKLRKNILQKIRRFKKYTGKFISVSALKKVSANVSAVGKEKKRRFLVMFLQALSRFHRDMYNYKLMKETIDNINLVTDDKIIRISRENRSLYEFRLPSEPFAETRPIIGHVVVKADVRGSTEIIGKMKEQGLNPATAFSMNYFDPIKNLLPHYGAEKIFIEGDAIILSLFEHEKSPDQWYGVSRACGLAINMIMVVRRYNRKNKESNLPRMVIGIGVSYCKGAPTFFYDDNMRIMISPAINEADVLSGCDPVARQHLVPENSVFNVYLFETDQKGGGDPGIKGSSILRYNIMGIELAPPAFKKLSAEIHLTRIQCAMPEFAKDPFVVYSGKFPTLSGTYERIVVREAGIPIVSFDDAKPLRFTGRKYYEVCTHPVIYEYVKRRQA